MLRSWIIIDMDRIYLSNYKSTEGVKQRRKELKRRKCKKQDAFIRTEGVQYQSGSFYTDKNLK